MRWYTQSGRLQRTADRKSDAWLTSPNGIAIDPQTCRMCRPRLLRPPRAPAQEQLDNAWFTARFVGHMGLPRVSDFLGNEPSNAADRTLPWLPVQSQLGSDSCR